jgi:hypothetical protein
MEYYDQVEVADAEPAQARGHAVQDGGPGVVVPGREPAGLGREDQAVCPGGPGGQHPADHGLHPGLAVQRGRVDQGGTAVDGGRHGQRGGVLVDLHLAGVLPGRAGDIADERRADPDDRDPQAGAAQPLGAQRRHHTLRIGTGAPSVSRCR